MNALDETLDDLGEEDADPMLDMDDADLAEMLSTSLTQVSQQQQQLAMMISELGQMMQMLSQRVESLGAYVAAPRQVVRDANGRPVGVRVVR